MSPLILRTATRYLVPLLLLFSLFLLWRGHHEPGGGFVGGLVAATAFVFIALAEGPQRARAVLRVRPTLLVPLGLTLSAVAGGLALAAGSPFLTGLWWRAADGTVSAAGTPLLFDVGVYTTVAGVVLAMLLGLMEETQ